MEKQKIVLLYGGIGSEHDVSRRSAASVYNWLDSAKFDVSLIGIKRSGEWFLQEQPRGKQELSVEEGKAQKVVLQPGEGLFTNQGKIEADCVLPLLHGSFSEDGRLQGLLDWARMPYLGSSLLGSAIGMDKEMTKIIWAKNGLPIVPFLKLKRADYLSDQFDLAAFSSECDIAFGFPVFVKPAANGSSVGISKVKEADEFKAALELAFAVDDKVLVEPGLFAREIECAVVGNDRVQSFPPGEVKTDQDFYSYEAKYHNDQGTSISIPADLSQEKMDFIRKTAEKAFLALEVRGYARIDFFIDQKTNIILLNEINTLPGMTSISMFPMMCAKGGLDHGPLFDKLIELAKEDFLKREALFF